ncbi:MAG: class I SAM-dependent methyltransferase [Candidatus Omnitrophica bacterium]|nr:class I SAM-dependent methyltransferase [Candidatus Omnitrophota bacterium]
MKAVDRIIQYLRIRKIAPYIERGSRVLDIGCADGAIFRQLRSRISEGVGIDIGRSRTEVLNNYRLISGRFPDDLPDARPFDVIAMLAVLEHIPPAHQQQLAKDCARFLKPGGKLLITVPSLRAEKVLDWLKSIRLIDGMSLEEHYGFDATQTPAIFSVGGVNLLRFETFQLGYNNLYVFVKG